MKKITIPLSGISRNTDDTISTDGDCMELINARVKNGSITPVGRPILEQQFPSGCNPIYIHQNAGYKNIICVQESGEKKNLSFYAEKKMTVFYSEQTSDIRINHIGNILCVTTDSGIQYFFFDKTYLSLGKSVPKPFVQFSTVMNGSRSEEGAYADINPAIPYPGTGTTFQLGESAMGVSNTIYGSITKLYDSVRKEGKFTFPVLVRYAYRLFDGSYIMQSNPILIQSGLKLYPTEAGNPPLIGLSSYSAHEWDKNLTGIRFSSFCTVYSINMEVRYENQDIEKWKDLVSSIDVFVSRQLTTFDFNGKIDKVTDTGDYGVKMSLEYLKKEAILNKIENEQLFYRAYTCVPKTGTHIIPEVYDISGVDHLPDDEFSHNVFIPKTTYVYNNRLHIGNLYTELYKGHDIRQLLYCSSRANSEDLTPVSITRGYIEVHIKTSSGISRVYNEFVNVDNFYGISPYLSYPDSRAFNMIISLTKSGVSYRREFELKPSSILNLAYTLLDILPIKLSSFAQSSISPTMENTREYTPNKLKVSELSNPFYFPAKQTYAIGQDEIIALCSNTTAISQGQFGQYPLYIFTSDGVYSAQVGTGDVVYSAVSPLSRDVCSNGKGVTPIDNAVVFTTSSGLMALSGSNTKKLSDKIEGYLPSSLTSSPVLARIINIPKLILSTTEFWDYIENASIGYVYEDQEIIVANKNYPYSYVHNSGEWHKISCRISGFLNSYPESLAVITNSDGYGMYRMHNQHRTVNDIAIITRPIKLGSVAHKRILQSALRAVIKPSLSNLYFRGEPVQFREENAQIFSEAGFYILGSNDAEHFSLLAGTERLNDVRDLITKMNKTKAYKYFIYCLVGGVRTDVAINYIEVMADEAFDNRLR